MSGPLPRVFLRAALVAKTTKSASCRVAEPVNRQQRRLLQHYQQRAARAATQR